MFSGILSVVCVFLFFSFMNNNGWIKLHRKIKDNPFYSNPNALALLIECLLRARHDDKEFYWKREKIQLKAGQFMFGDKELGKTFKIGKTTTRYWLEQFIVDGIVDIKRTTKGSIITILKWKEYQVVDSPVDNKRETKGKRKDTNKNNKNDNNDKKNIIYATFKKLINPNSKLTDKARQKIKARLKTFSEHEILKAMENFSKDSWWMEHNANRGVAWFFHTDERIDQLINLKPKQIKSEDDVVIPSYARKYQKND